MTGLFFTKVSEQWLKVADSWLVDEDPYLWSVELKTIEFELMGGPEGGWVYWNVEW